MSFITLGVLSDEYVYQWHKQGCTGCRCTPRMSSHVFSAAWKLRMWFNARLITAMKRHLQPLDAFPGLLMRPKCISGRGPMLAPQEPFPRSRLSTSNFGLSSIRSAPPKTNSWLRRWRLCPISLKKKQRVKEQNKARPTRKISQGVPRSWQLDTITFNVISPLSTIVH